MEQIMHLQVQFTGIFSPLLPENLNVFSADGDEVTDRLPDGLTDESNDVWIKRNFPMIWTFGNFVQQ